MSGDSENKEPVDEVEAGGEDLEKEQAVIEQRSTAPTGDSAAEDSAQPAPTAKKKRRKKKPSEPTSAAPIPPAPAAQKRTLMIAGLLVVALAAVGIYFVVRGSSGPTWKPGTETEVELTVVAADAKNLACASLEEVAGRHCAFEAAAKPWSKSTDQDDKNILKPYTTTEKRSLIAAGLWSEPALKGKLPTGRFTVKCKFTIEGKLTKPQVRWNTTGPFIETSNEWSAGVLSGCSIADAPAAAPSASAAATP